MELINSLCVHQVPLPNGLEGPETKVELQALQF